MDIEYEMGELIFEWDDRKNLLNQIKHGISFETAIGVREDVNRIETLGEIHSTVNEVRFRTIEMIAEQIMILVLIYTEREERYRIISARKATKSERKEYYDRILYA